MVSGVFVQSTSPLRRAAGLLAAGTLGMSTAVLGLGGVAHAAPLEAFSVGTDPSEDVVVDGDWTVPAGYCQIDWTLAGAGGGRSSDNNEGGYGGYLEVTTPVTPGDVLAITAGGAGGNADATAGGEAGSGAAGYAGAAGQIGEYADLNGGGGGGASTVIGAEVSLVAFGGAGAAASDANGGAGGAGGGGTENTVTWPDSSVDYDEVGGGGGGGYVYGWVTPCTLPPPAPTGLYGSAGDASLTVAFERVWSEGPNGSDADSWEYSLNGGSTWVAADTTEYYGTFEFTVSRLTNGTTYAVRVRGVSDTAGPGAASSALHLTPAKPIGAPTGVVAKAGPSSVTITWSAPTSAGSFPVASYVVGWSGGQMGGPACESVPVSAERVCVFPAQPGNTYSFSVWAVDTKGNDGLPSAMVSAGKTPEPKLPATVPAAQGELEVPADQQGPMAVGTEITLRGTGYLPFSTVTVAIYSEPQVLTSVVTDATGSFEVTVTIPEGLANGDHTLVASGVDPDGNVRYLALPVTVTGGITGAGGLAYTGFDIAAPLTGGLAALAVGAGLMVVSRRRAAA